MLYEITMGERLYRLELRRSEQGWDCTLDGDNVPVDVAEISSGQISLLLNGQSFVVKRGAEGAIFVGNSPYQPSIKDSRSWRKRGQLRQSGPLQLKASMPGKVVRLLAHEGDAIHEGQGLIVVEAMKMQNEIKSPKAGALQKLLVREGINVNAGDALAIVE